VHRRFGALTRPFHLVSLVVPPGDAEIAGDLLWQAGAWAVSESPRSDGLIEIRGDADPARVTAPAEDREWAVTVELLDPAEPWLDEWRAHAQPIRVGRIVVVPAWLDEQPVHRNDVVVRIDPGRCFGSGAHPTTQLALAGLDRLVRPRISVLDVGCGSGVLSIAAALLGAAHVTAIDVDPMAVDVTRDNAARNGVADVVVATTTALAAVEGTFDLVVANVGEAIAAELEADLDGHVARHGALLLGGLLDDSGRWTQVRRERSS
jgi:ribosomal protein L11 methyltransferase